MQSHQISICSWSLRPRTPELLISDLQKCGITKVQLALVPLFESEEWSNCGQALHDAGVAITSGMFEPAGEDYSTLETIAKTGGIRQDSMWSKTLVRANASAQIASNLGLSLVTFHAGFLPHNLSEERTKLLDRLFQIADIFTRNEIAVAFETGQETGEVLAGVLEELSHPNIGVNFDPANMILYGQGDPVAAITMLTPWVRQVHIKDAIATTVAGTWGSEAVVGTGDVDWDAFIPAIPSGVDLVIEREAGDNRIEDIRRAISFLQEQGC